MSDVDDRDLADETMSTRIPADLSGGLRKLSRAAPPINARRSEALFFVRGRAPETSIPKASVGINIKSDDVKRILIKTDATTKQTLEASHLFSNRSTQSRRL